MEVKETRELTTTEMLDKEKQLKEELLSLGSQSATSQLENTVCIKGARQSVVRIKTVLCGQVN